MQWVLLAIAMVLAGLLSGLIVVLAARRAAAQWSAALAYFGLVSTPDPEPSSDAPALEDLP